MTTRIDNGCWSAAGVLLWSGGRSWMGCSGEDRGIGSEGSCEERVWIEYLRV